MDSNDQPTRRQFLKAAAAGAVAAATGEGCAAVQKVGEIAIPLLAFFDNQKVLNDLAGAKLSGEMGETLGKIDHYLTAAAELQKGLGDLKAAPDAKQKLEQLLEMGGAVEAALAQQGVQGNDRWKEYLSNAAREAMKQGERELAATGQKPRSERIRMLAIPLRNLKRDDWESLLQAEREIHERLGQAVDRAADSRHPNRIAEELRQSLGADNDPRVIGSKAWEERRDRIRER